jgi:hypothetical protein
MCPITRSEFRTNAKHLTATIDGQTVLVPVKDFSTGSFGWYSNGKMTLQVNGKAVTVQIGLTLTIVGSKEVPQDAPQS